MKTWKILLSLAFLPALFAAPFSKEDLEEGRKMLTEMKQLRRKPYWEKPKYFVRSQTKYSGALYQSRYHWTDRPLFNNRKLQAPSAVHSGDSAETAARTQSASFRRTIELYKLCQLDGFATFAWPQDYRYHYVLKPLFDTATAMDYPVLLETAPGYLATKQYPPTLDLLRDGKPSVRLRDGKVLFSSYVMDQLPPEKIAQLLKAYQKAGHPGVTLLPQMDFSQFRFNNRPMNSFAIYAVYCKNGTLPASLIREMQAYLRRYRDVCAGLYLSGHMVKADRTYDARYTDEVLVPIYKSVLAEPGADGNKIFAIHGKTGYTCHDGCYTLSRNGTKTVRQFLDTMRGSGADLYIGTEWDELNEDTGFEPLVGKPMSTMRIFRYYLAQAKQEKLAPLPGDDLSRPNLIVSQRRQIIIGTTFHVELLNVPDGSFNDRYTVQVTFSDENGKQLFRSKPLVFHGEKLEEKKLELPSEKFASAQALCTKLIVTRNGKKQEYTGFPFTILRAATNQFEYSCTPLRNLLVPKHQKISFAPDRVKIEMDAGTPVATAEVMQNNLEFFSYDPHDEFLRNDPERVFFRFIKLANNPPPRLQADLSLEVTNAPSLVVFHNVGGAEKALQMKNFPAWKNFRIDIWDAPQVFFSVKRSDLAKARFVATLLRLNGVKKGETLRWEQPLAEVTQRVPANTISPDGICFVLEREGRPAVQALPFETSRFSFDRKLAFDDPDGVFSLRVVTSDGKVFWSAPYCRPVSLEKGKTMEAFYSDKQQRYITLPLAARRLEGVKYLFSPKHGYLLIAENGKRELFGIAGGPFAAATGFQGTEANHYPQGSMTRNTKVPATAKCRPEWVQEKEGFWALDFDGENGNSLSFGASVLPNAAGFTLRMELLPRRFDNAPQLLSFGRYRAFTAGITKEGKLECAYFSLDPAGRRSSRRVFCYSAEPLKLNVYNECILRYDGNKLTVTVNGKSSSVPLTGIRIYQFPMCFGADFSAGYSGGSFRNCFDGRLRALEIRYTPGE